MASCICNACLSCRGITSRRDRPCITMQANVMMLTFIASICANCTVALDPKVLSDPILLLVHLSHCCVCPLLHGSTSCYPASLQQVHWIPLLQAMMLCGIPQQREMMTMFWLSMLYAGMKALQSVPNTDVILGRSCPSPHRLLDFRSAECISEHVGSLRQSAIAPCVSRYVAQMPHITFGFPSHRIPFHFIASESNR